MVSNKKCSWPSSIMLFLKDIWRLCHNLNIYSYCHIYREGIEQNIILFSFLFFYFEMIILFS